MADPIRGKPYIEIRLDRARAARLGVSAGEVNELIETALAGKVVTSTVEGRERHPVVVRYGRAWREDEESVRNLLVTARGAGQGPGSSPSKPEPQLIPLSEVADVQVVEGPATIKSENGLLRNYVRVNVRDRDAADLVAEARLAVATRGQAARTASSSSGPASSSTRSVRGGRLMLVVPIVVALDLPGPVPDLSRPGRRGADDAGRAGRDRRRAVLPVAAGTEALGDGLGRLHRLFRHGDLDRDHHAGLPARGRRQGGRPGADEPGRAAHGGA